MQYKALSMLNSEIVVRFSSTTQMVQAQMASTDPKGDSLVYEAALEMSPPFRQFMLCAPTLRPLCSELEKRTSSTTSEYTPTLVISHLIV